MDLATTRQMFNDGFFSQGFVEKERESGEVKLIILKPTQERLALTKAKSGDVKIYRTIDAAIADADSIGFKEVPVKLI